MAAAARPSTHTSAVGVWAAKAVRRDVECRVGVVQWRVEGEVRAGGTPPPPPLLAPPHTPLTATPKVLLVQGSATKGSREVMFCWKRWVVMREVSLGELRWYCTRVEELKGGGKRGGGRGSRNTSGSELALKQFQLRGYVVRVVGRTLRVVMESARGMPSRLSASKSTSLEAAWM
jgi:hypothetical protein